jgi:hypothetical protein
MFDGDVDKRPKEAVEGLANLLSTLWPCSKRLCELSEAAGICKNDSRGKARENRVVPAVHWCLEENLPLLQIDKAMANASANCARHEA